MSRRRTAHVYVEVGGQAFAVPVASVREVADLGSYAPIPGAPPGILGVRNLRGQVLPILDSAPLLGLTREREPQRIIVVEDGGRLAGLAVDEVSDVRVAPPGDDTQTIEVGPLLDSLAADAP